MAEYTGKNMIFSWVHAGGTVAMQADFRTVNLSPTIDFADSTAGSDARRSRIPTIADVTVSYSGLAQTGGTVLEDALQEGDEGTIIFQPEGTVTGKRKYTIGAFSQGPKYNYPYADVVELSVEFLGNGTFTVGVN
jgi:hypothetical protein